MATIIGQLIGSLEVDTAKRYYKTIKIIGLGSYLVLLLISEVFKIQIIGSFTSHESIIKETLGVYIVMQVDMLADLFKGVNNGMLQGLALQKRVIGLNVAAYWLILIPSVYFLAFTMKLDLLGIWLGKTVMGLFYFLTVYSVIERHDWRNSARDSWTRQQEDAKKVQED